MATANELRQMTQEELSRMAEETRQTVFNLQLKHKTGHLENTSEMGRSRKELARLLTLLREGQLGLARKVHAEAAKPARAAAGEAGSSDDEKGAKKKGAAKAAAKAPKAAKPKKAAK
ncbi:MAG TPA: 50S ribosomal protein L29 [Myxococcales bacterium]|nr:50S ribosomal protein L29 [Myxococcales bacterium]